MAGITFTVIILKHGQKPTYINWRQNVKTYYTTSIWFVKVPRYAYCGILYYFGTDKPSIFNRIYKPTQSIKTMYTLFSEQIVSVVYLVSSRFIVYVYSICLQYLFYRVCLQYLFTGSVLSCMFTVSVYSISFSIRLTHMVFFAFPFRRLLGVR